MATGIAPAVLLEDDEWLPALRQATAERWGHVEELLATLIEVQHAHFAAFIKAHAKEGSPQVKPLHIPRPNDPVAAKPSVGEIAAWFSGRR